MQTVSKHFSRFKGAEIAGLEVIFFFILPITLLYFKIIPVSSRMYILLIFTVLIYGVIKKQHWTNEDLGLTTKNIKKFLPVYFVTTSLAFITIVAVAIFFGFHPIPRWWTQPHFLFLFIAISFFQEFAFRGFLIPLLKKVFPDTFTIITVNALLFAGMHAIYPFAYIGLPFAFMGGLFFAILYHKYPNLILVSISHSILNFIVVLFGLFAIVVSH